MLRMSRIIAGAYLGLTLVLAVITVLSGPIGWAPLPLPTTAPPIRVELAIGSEKEAWIRSALERFAQTQPNVNGRAIEVRLRVAGSVALINAIEREGYQPTAISPASSLQLADIRQWRADLLGDQAQSLAFSPLVALMREAPVTADIDNPWNLWQRTLPDRINQLKIGISAPDQSNGGLQTLIILAAQYHDSQSGLTLDQARDSELRAWLSDLNQRIGNWPASTGTLTNDFVLKTGTYDIITTYENTALRALRQAEGRGTRARIFYPSVTTVSDHPYAILTAPWVSDAERAAARVLGNFLLSPAEQAIAMREYGFRPAIPQVTIDLNDPTSLFGRYRDRGLQLDLAAQLPPPAPEVINALVETWRSAIGR